MHVRTSINHIIVDALLSCLQYEIEVDTSTSQLTSWNRDRTTSNKIKFGSIFEGFRSIFDGICKLASESIEILCKSISCK